MAQDKVRMPSGQGGLTRYFDEERSKFELSPMGVMILAIIIMVLVILLHVFADAFIG